MARQSRPKMHLLVRQASHFLQWELPLFGNVFDLVEEPAHDAILFAYGPDVLEMGARLPCRGRVAMMFPGFGLNPYHDISYRNQALALLDSEYDLFFVNPGPLESAFRESKKMRVCDFTVDTDLVDIRRYRNKLDSLIHVSSDYPQKDWRRSEEVMRRTGLEFEVFPPRQMGAEQRQSVVSRVVRRVERTGRRLLKASPPPGYVGHRAVVRKYQQFDGFVHVASDIKNPLYIDGKYTACLIEAGITGSILFWHDTLGLGNELETVFELPVAPEEAAETLLDIRTHLDVERHSRLTREEMLDRFSPTRSVALRSSLIKELTL